MISPLNKRGLLLLDRDGVLNRMLRHPVRGLDSPHFPDEVEVDPDVPEALLILQNLGFGLTIVTNQPAAKMGKTTQQNLEEVHRIVLAKIQSKGAKILSSHICYHVNEDACLCRKPKTGLLEEALKAHAEFDFNTSWMIGDRITDIRAGKALGLKTAFIEEFGNTELLKQNGLFPDFSCLKLMHFAHYLETL